MPTKIFSAYLFLGEEDFLKEEAIEKAKSKFLDDQTKELNYSIFYAKDKNFNIRGMLDSLNTLPFLSKKRLIILKDADSLTVSGKASVLSYLGAPKESSVFIMETSLPAIKGEFLLKGSKLAHLVYFRRPTGPGIDSWLIKKAGLSKKKISAEAIAAIKESLPNDLRTLSSAMDKIVLYAGNRSLITKQDVEKIAGTNPSHAAFDLIDAIAVRDVKKALRIFSSLKRDRKKQAEFLGLLAWNARMLLRVKELFRIKNKIEISRDLGLSTRSFDRITRHAARFKKEQVLTLLDEIIKADLDIKTGDSSTIVMEKLITKMCV